MNTNTWVKMERRVRDIIEERREAALTTRSFEEREYERGWVDALRLILELPEQIKGESDEKDGQETQDGHDEKEEVQKEKGVIVLGQRNRSRRTEFFR